MAANVRHDSRVHLIAFAFLDPLLARPAPVVEGNDALGRAAQACHDEEIGMEPAHLVRRSSDRALEQIADPVLQDPVRWQPDRILDPLRFEKLVDLGIGKAGVSPEIDARNLALISRQDGLQHSVPSVGAVNVAGTQNAAFQVTVNTNNG